MAGFSRADDNAAPVPGAKILVVAARFNDNIVSLLREGALAALERLGAKVTLIEVPGALEIAPAIAIALDVAQKAARPMMASSRLAASFAAKPITSRSSPMRARGRSPISPFQTDCRSAMESSPWKMNNRPFSRADPKQGDKGGDAALAALALVRLARKLGART